MKFKSLAAAIVAVLPAAAMAQDYSGPSVGAQINLADAETEGPELSGDDTLFGLRAYYDVDAGSFIYGGGLQYDNADLDLDGAASVSSVLRLAGRAGANVGGGYLYGTAGLARATTDDGAASAGDSNGTFFGAGFETFVADGTTIGFEILQHNFDDFDIETLEADVTTVGANVNFRF